MWILVGVVAGTGVSVLAIMLLPDGLQPALEYHSQAAAEYLGPATISGPSVVLKASWYGSESARKPMANGELFDPTRYTCASWDYPLGTWLRISVGDKGVYCKVTDRGPAKRLLTTRQIDLSEAAFSQLGDTRKGIMSVMVQEIVQ